MLARGLARPAGRSRGRPPPAPSTRGCRSRIADRPGSTMMWPISDGEPVRAAEQPAVGHDPAADPGPDGDEQHVVVPASGAETELAVRGHARVVVDLARQPERLAQSARAIGRSRHARFGAKRSTPVGRVDQSGGSDARPRRRRRVEHGPRAGRSSARAIASASSAGVAMFSRSRTHRPGRRGTS